MSMNLTILDDEDDFEYENLEDSEDEIDLENSLDEFLEAEIYRNFLNDNGFEFGDEDDDDFDDYIDPLYNY
ncbi:unnamed protein product [Caenorhabditis angaria]|uniref:Uncharacterized protein n=1 Tax=Caenorhabditis angaria TaxID=860376 RepID=A0A9P1MXH9_9PELO|nr:unnamed protein product [Caenorhabditis angaria]